MTSTRILSAAIFAAIFLTALYWTPLRLIVPLIALAAALVCAHEYTHAATAAGHAPARWVTLAVALAFACDGLIGHSVGTVAILSAGLMIAAMVSLARNRVERATADMAVTLFGGVYAGLPIGLLMSISWRDAGASRHEVLEGNFLMVFLIALTWLSDSGAYFVGRAWGRTRLCEKISPKKSVEGLLGGIFTTLAFAVLLRSLPIPGREILRWADAIALGIAICLIAPIGDLAMSMIKRDAKIKDSGRDLTGHGGLLDTIDSLLFSAPAALIYLLLARPELLPPDLK